MVHALFYLIANYTYKNKKCVLAFRKENHNHYLPGYLKILLFSVRG